MTSLTQSNMFPCKKKKFYPSFNRLENVIFLVIMRSFIVSCVIPFGWVSCNSWIDQFWSWILLGLTFQWLEYTYSTICQSFKPVLGLCLSVSSAKSIFSLWSTDMPAWSFFPTRVKSSAMDWVHINTCGKGNFKYLHFEIPEFSLKSVS